MKHLKSIVASPLLALSLLSTTATAAPVICSDTSINYMNTDDTYVSSCLGSGLGVLQGDNALQDEFLSGSTGTDWSFVAKVEVNTDGTVDPDPSTGLTYTQTTQTSTDSTGTFTFNASLWGSGSPLAIGFKFGTGKTNGQDNPDEWFVYELQNGIFTGDWSFINVLGGGGGLSHLNLYTKDSTVPGSPVSESGTATMLILGLAGIAAIRRRRTS